MGKKQVDVGSKVTDEYITFSSCYGVMCIQGSADIYFIFSLLGVQPRSENFIIF